MEEVSIPGEIGILPLRNSVLFPHAIMPISVGRRKTLNLLDSVVKESKLIAVVSQRNPAEDDPDPEGMYRVGTIARILKVVKLSGNNVNLIIQVHTSCCISHKERSKLITSSNLLLIVCSQPYIAAS